MTNGSSSAEIWGTKRPARHRTIAIAALLLALPCSVKAQFALIGDASIHSSYVWRGITRTTRPVLQGSALLAWLPRGWTVTTGAWASVEPFRPGARDLSDAGRDGGAGEFDYWLEAHTRVGKIDVRVGHIWYDLRGNRTAIGPGSGFDTAEAYAGIMFLPTLLTGIGTTLYWDHDAIDGGFATFDAFRDEPLVQVRSWIVTFTPQLQAGVSMGQATDDDPFETGYFVDDGLAYVNASAGLYATSPKWASYIAATVQYNRDAATRVTRLDGESHKAKVWFEAGISYTTGSPPTAR